MDNAIFYIRSSTGLGTFMYMRNFQQTQTPIGPTPVVFPLQEINGNEKPSIWIEGLRIVTLEQFRWQDIPKNPARADRSEGFLGFFPEPL